MVEALLARSALAETLRTGRHGQGEGTAGVRIIERVIGGALSVACRDAGRDMLSRALGWPLPANPRCVVCDGHWILWAGPGRWLVFSDTDMERDVRARAGALGSVADQSDSRIVLRVEGAHVRDLLAKGVSIDLHPRVFAVGDAAATLCAHIAVLIWREDESGFGIAVPRGFAVSLATFLLESAMEYGVHVG